MVMDVKAVQSENAKASILITIFPMVTFVKLVRTAEGSVGIEVIVAV